MLRCKLERPDSPSSELCSENLEKYASYKNYVPIIENGKKRKKYFCDECSFEFTSQNLRIEIDKEMFPFKKQKCDHCSSIKISLFYNMYVLCRRTMPEIFKIVYSYYYDDVYFPKYIMIQKIWRGYIIRKKKSKNASVFALNNYLLSANSYVNEYDKLRIYESTNCELDLLSQTP